MRVVIVMATWLASALYALMKLLPQRRKVVFLSRQSSRPSRDFTLLRAELERRDPSLEVVVRCRFIGPGLAERVAYVAEVLAQMYHLATAAVCVVDGYIVPVSVLSHRRSLTVIQMWHALGAIKEFGLQAVGRPGGRDSDVASAMRMHRNYDFVLCGSPAWVPVFAEAFGADHAAVLPLGLPRVDYLVASADSLASGSPPPGVAKLLEQFPRLADAEKTVVLYAPTFRKSAECAFSAVASAFADDSFTLVIKPHDLDSAVLGGANVIDATGANILDLLPIAHAVITDYSAVAFEACAIARPTYFYVYDIEEYAVDHGLNLDPLVQAQGLAFTDIAPIAARIAEHDYNVESARAFCAVYGPPNDGACTRRIADLITDRIPSA